MLVPRGGGGIVPARMIPQNAKVKKLAATMRAVVKCKKSVRHGKITTGKVW